MTIQATERATPKQVGRIMGEFRRLGFHVEYDRDERLSITATLAGLRELNSANDLTMGQAGRVIRVISECETTQDLYSLARPRSVLTRLFMWLAT